MKRLIMVLGLISLGLLSGAVPTNSLVASSVPLPPNVEITPPEPGLAPEISAFSGKRTGIWDGSSLESILIVEEVNSEKAKVIYAWGDDPKHNVQKGWSRQIAKIIPGSKPKIEFGGDGKDQPKFVFEMGKDLKAIRGTREFKGSYITITMKPLSE